MHRFLSRFTMFDLTLMAMLAVLGIATKPIITPLVHMITGPLFIPGGTVAGGFYMMWVVLARFLVNKNGSATITCLIQAILVMALGIIGSHGVLSLLTYLIPGLAIDLGLFISGNPRQSTLFYAFLAGILANTSGTFLVNVVFFRLPLIPLLLSIFAGALSGGAGGIIAHQLLRQLRKTPLFKTGVHVMILLLILPVALAGCTNGEIESKNILTIKGDVNSALELASLPGETKEILPILEKAEPRDPKYMMLIGSDGEAAQIPFAHVGQSLLTIYEGKWEFRSDHLPRSSRIKDLVEIIIVGETAPLGLITPADNLLQVTPGEFWAGNRNIYNLYRGESSQIVGPQEYHTSRHLFIEGLDPEDYLPWGSDEWLGVNRLGEEVFLTPGTAFIALEDNSFKLLNERGQVLLDDLVGIMANPPAVSITDVAPLAKNLITEGKSVLLILVDGLGWEQYQYARQEGLTPFLNSLEPAQKARAAYPPITNVNLAALLTGELPLTSGIHVRRDREPQTPTILGWAQEKALNVEYLAGRINPLLTEILPRTHAHGDEGIIKSAREVVTEELDLLLIHFKELDLQGHEYGPFHSKTMNTLTIIDGYLEELWQEWPGDMLVISDHGMRPTPDGGNHGWFFYQDMIIPFIHCQGGS